jgi:hypothetical protein
MMGRVQFMAGVSEWTGVGRDAIQFVGVPDFRTDGSRG